MTNYEDITQLHGGNVESKKHPHEINVLIACEESQRVCAAFRERGFNAYSCDLQECSGGHPEWHIRDDALRYINGDQAIFWTSDKVGHITPERWDLIIAHPPCTYLTVTGNRWFNAERYGDKAIKRISDRVEAAEFFMYFVNAKCDHIAVENPIGYMNTRYRKPDQIVQPYWFGDHARKATCLWLKNLPPLEKTDEVDPGEIYKGGFSVGASMCYAKDENGKIIRWNDKRTAIARSKTFPGIAKAMAEQWGDYLMEVCE